VNQSVPEKIVVLAQDMRKAVLDYYGDTMPRFLRDYMEGRITEMRRLAREYTDNA
jgi:hypothetical protein